MGLTCFIFRFLRRPQVEDAADDHSAHLHLSYAAMLAALRFAEEQKIIPPLSPHWWARVEQTDGCTFQG